MIGHRSHLRNTRVGLLAFALLLAALAACGGNSTATPASQATTATTSAALSATGTTAAGVASTTSPTGVAPASPTTAATTRTATAAGTTTRTTVASGTGGTTTRGTTTGQATAGVTTRTATGTAPGTPGTGTVLAPLAGGRRYVDPQGRFSLSVPEDYREDTSDGVDVAFELPSGNSGVAVTLEDTSAVPGLTLDQYNAIIERQLPQRFPAYTPVSLDRVVIGGQPAYRRVFRATQEGETLQIALLYFLVDSTAHTLVFGAPPDEFASQEATFNGIAGSYRPGP